MLLRWRASDYNFLDRNRSNYICVMFSFLHILKSPCRPRFSSYEADYDWRRVVHFRGGLLNKNEIRSKQWFSPSQCRRSTVFSAMRTRRVWKCCRKVIFFLFTFKTSVYRVCNECVSHGVQIVAQIENATKSEHAFTLLPRVLRVSCYNNTYTAYYCNFVTFKWRRYISAVPREIRITALTYSHHVVRSAVYTIHGLYNIIMIAKKK